MVRLDILCVTKGFIESRTKSKNLILSGRVSVNGKIIKKPSELVSSEAEINVLPSEDDYVSRGALKLAKAKEVFDIDFVDRVVLDIGSSTGGFTEVALENGAKKVIALDVGTNILHERLRKDKRVISMENTDFRFVDGEKIKEASLIVTDVSFISVRYLFVKILETFGKNIEMVLLFKPQFECGEAMAKKYNGVIRNSKIHKQLLLEFVDYIQNLGFQISGFDYSPITGKEGNIEYLMYLNGKENQKYNIEKTIDSAFTNL
jgi:23S rRNA (cytidine1920-2'-O)/16S rRNA (cytidine1409-2'-O)-methyltransferase